jgi:hypothetical protein
MKLFVAFRYTEQDKWIKELVIPLIETLDIGVLTGENIHGQIIVEEVREMIKKSDAMIAFITSSWAEHPWVRDELVTALAAKIPSLEIKDQTLVNLGGIADGRQRLEFDIDKKEILLVQLAKVLSGWKKQHSTRSLLLLPDEVMTAARPHLRSGQLKCMYQFRDGNEESPLYETTPFRLPQALAVDIKNIPSENALVQLTIQGPAFSYSCGYQAFGFIPINLQKD